MSVTAPPHPPRTTDPLDRDELDALVEALIEEARQRARRRRRLYGAVAALLLLGAGAAWAVVDLGGRLPAASAGRPTSSNAAASGTGARIAFIRGSFSFAGGAHFGEADSELWVMNPDGSGQRRLARIANHAGSPAWSPDTRQVAFTRQGEAGGVYVVNADGTGLRLLAERGGGPVWSPDGQRIVFGRGASGDTEIYVVNADGSRERRLTRNTEEDWGAHWSPDGRSILFVGERDGALGLYVVDVETAEERLLTQNAGPGAWSPDRRRIGFAGDDGIYVVNADGTGKRRLTPRGVEAYDPRAVAWSSDGERLAFFGKGLEPEPCKSYPNGDPVCGVGIYVVNADGSGLRNLKGDPEFDLAQLSWSPDGRQLAYARRSDDGFDVYVVNTDGTGLRELTPGSGDDINPSWTPAVGQTPTRGGSHP